jgi:hypothetical protein
VPTAHSDVSMFKQGILFKGLNEHAVFQDIMFAQARSKEM